jgi:tripartite-type tricarboxylate transporter receptor subunit TctC
MTLPRRKFLHFAAGAAALPATSQMVRAQAYPARPVAIIVGFPAGGGSDMAARLTGQWLSQRLGQSFIIENRAGAGSNIAAEAAAQAVPDGYTLLLVTAANTINTTLHHNLSFNLIRDMVPIAGVMRLPNVMVVNPRVPASTVPEFIAYARANPGKINMASGGYGTMIHVAGELFKMMANVDLVHVPYQGGAPALTDLVGGQVQVMFDLMSASIGFIRAGELRALAVTTANRSEVLPELPTLAEFLPGYEASSWHGLAAPRNTPSKIIDTLNRESNAGLADSKFKARLADFGGKPLAGSPTEFGKFIVEETTKWAKVIKSANIKAG